MLRELRGMECPRCRTDLEFIVHRGIELSHCPLCDDWSAEYGDLISLGAVVTFLELPAELLEPFGASGCAICGQPLLCFQYGGRRVEIERCAEEHAFWFPLDPSVDDEAPEYPLDDLDALLRALQRRSFWSRLKSWLSGSRFLALSRSR